MDNQSHRLDIDLSQYISSVAAAEMLGVTGSGMRWLLKYKRIKGIKIGRDWLVLLSSVEAYKAKRDMQK